MPNPLPGSKGLKPIGEGLRKAFPDLHFSIKNIVVTENQVAIHKKLMGIPKGAMAPLARFLRAELLSGFHPGEVEDVADGVGVGEEHDEAIDADAYAACWGHALADGFDEFFVHGAGFFVAGVSA